MSETPGEERRAAWRRITHAMEPARVAFARRPGPVEQLQARLSQVLLELRAPPQDNLSTEQKKRAGFQRVNVSARCNGAQDARGGAGGRRDGRIGARPRARAGKRRAGLTLTIAETEKLRYGECSSFSTCSAAHGRRRVECKARGARRARGPREVVQGLAPLSVHYLKSAKRLRKRVITQVFGKLKAPWATEANAKVFKALAALRMRKRRAAMSSWAAFAAARKAKMRRTEDRASPHSATVACARASTLGARAGAPALPVRAAYGLGRARVARHRLAQAGWLHMLERFSPDAIMIAAVKSIQHRRHACGAQPNVREHKRGEGEAAEDWRRSEVDQSRHARPSARFEYF